MNACVRACVCARARLFPYDFLYLYVYVCVLHTCLSVALKCLTVLSCPQSVKSRKVAKNKFKKRKKKQRTE